MALWAKKAGISINAFIREDAEKQRDGNVVYDEDGRNPVFFYEIWGIYKDELLKDSNYENLNCQNVNGI